LEVRGLSHPRSLAARVFIVVHGTELMDGELRLLELRWRETWSAYLWTMAPRVCRPWVGVAASSTD